MTTTRNRRNRSIVSSRRARRVLCEALEERQLMALTITLREANGAASATVGTVGQVINLELLATVTSANNIPTQDALQDVAGQIISSGTDGHAVGGNLADANVAPLNAIGSSTGTLQDLNGDGNIDIGGNSRSSTAGDFFARSSSPEQSAAGTIVDSGTALQFEIGTVTYTVTSLGEGGTTSINFFPNVSDRPDSAAWYEAFQPLSNVTGTFVAGAPFTVNDPALVVAPTAKPDSATIIRSTPTSVNVLGNDDFVRPLNKASVAIGTAPAHGTAVPQTDGTVLYTPTTGYTGPDSFTYTVQDVDGRVSNSATVTLTVVTPPPPTANADTASTLLNQPVTVNVLANDSTTAPATLTPGSVTIATVPTHGSAVAQSNGSVIYTPASGYLGTDTFTYTVTDTNGETSAAATVTVTVAAPTPPTAGDVASSTTAGAPVTVNVLGSDSTPQGSLNAASVTVVTQPAHGTAVAQADGTIIYTPTAKYVGADSFTYTVADSFGDVSNTATVSMTITTAVPPVAGDVTAPALSGTTNTINVLGNVSSGAPLVPGTVTIVTPPADGTATVNTATGAISYVPNAGFVGTDTFTYSVGNTNQDTSNIATVSVDVGTSISRAKGSTAKTLSFVDAAGGSETVTISSGTAELFFSGTGGSVTVSKGGKATVTGTGLQISGITVTGTNRGSVLNIRGPAKQTVNVGGIIDASPLGSIVGTNTALSGSVQLAGVGTINVQSISNATIAVGSGLPGRLSLISGAISTTSLASLEPIVTLRAASWSGQSAQTGPVNIANGMMTVDFGTGGIAAPSINTLSVAGVFSPDVQLSANGRAFTLNSARISGAVTGGAWTIAGPVNSVSYGSTAAGWSGMFGKVNSINIRAGGLTPPVANAQGATLTTGVLGSLTITGDVTANISATSARLVRVNGNMNGSTLLITGAMGQFVATGALLSSAISTGQGLNLLSAGALNGTEVSVGALTGTTIGTASSSNLGTVILGTLRLTGKTGDQFTNSQVLASKINSASVGSITTANNGTPFGLGVKSIGTFSGIFAGSPLHIPHADLVSDTLLTAFVQQQGDDFGNFEIVIAG